MVGEVVSPQRTRRTSFFIDSASIRRHAMAPKFRTCGRIRQTRRARRVDLSRVSSDCVGPNSRATVRDVAVGLDHGPRPTLRTIFVDATGWLYDGTTWPCAIRTSRRVGFVFVCKRRRSVKSSPRKVRRVWILFALRSVVFADSSRAPRKSEGASLVLTVFRNENSKKNLPLTPSPLLLWGNAMTISRPQPRTWFERSHPRLSYNRYFSRRREIVISFKSFWSRFALPESAVRAYSQMTLQRPGVQVLLFAHLVRVLQYESDRDTCSSISTKFLERAHRSTVRSGRYALLSRVLGVQQARPDRGLLHSLLDGVLHLLANYQYKREIVNSHDGRPLHLDWAVHSRDALCLLESNR